MAAGGYPVGKLPAERLATLLARAPISDPRVHQGPGVGLDCAVVDVGDRYLVFKSDPITFASDQIGEYLVQINTNDIATTGARPCWLLVTLLLPEASTTAALVESIFEQIYAACRRLDISVIGGHSEITYGLDRPIAAATLVGEVAYEALVSPRGARPGDRLLLTKGVPVEATAVIGHEFTARLADTFSAGELARARAFLQDPGISVLSDARIAIAAGRVSAMHDPTEGGLLTALSELASACGQRVVFDPATVPVPDLSARLCRHLDIDPLASLASGALLLTAPAGEADVIRRALTDEGIDCAEIGYVEAGDPGVFREVDGARQPVDIPPRDELARLLETQT